MRILLITPEYERLVKVGGLADFSRAIGQALARQGHDVRVLMPCYAKLPQSVRHYQQSWNVKSRLSIWETFDTEIGLWQDGQVAVYLLNYPEFFGRGGIYDEFGFPYADNPKRYALLSHTAFGLCKALNWFPDIFHASDWQGAMVPFYRRIHFAHDPDFLHTSTVLTIHNGAYQGRFDASWHEALGIHPQFMVPSLFEDMGTLNLLKAGVTLAEKVVTVSPSYRNELLEAETSHGLFHTFRHRHRDFLGVLNGVALDEWDPASDPHISTHYNVRYMQGKARCKRQTMADNGLEVHVERPLFAYIGRVVEQKGFGLLLPVLQQLLAQQDIAVAVVGHGEPRYQHPLAELQSRYPDRFVYIDQFTEQSTRPWLASADFLLMPSLFEPCGLSQMYAMRYGTLPIVHAVGGLRDTVHDLDSTHANRSIATGFAFYEATETALTEAMMRAIELYVQAPMTLRMMQRNGMNRDNDWDQCAQAYTQIYQSCSNQQDTDPHSGLRPHRYANG